MALRSGGLWRRAYEVDFTSLSNFNIKTGGNGNKTIDGKVWLWGNDANCATADIVNGTGLVITANAAVTGYYEGANVRTAPNLTIPILSVVPLFNISQNAIRVTTRMLLTNADQNTEGGKLFIEYVTAPETQNVSIAKWFTAGALGYQVNESHNPTFTAPYPNNTTSTADDILSLIFWPNRNYEAYSGLYVAGEKMRVRTSRTAFFHDIAQPPIKVNTDVRLGLCQVTNNATAALTTTFTHLRVDFHDRHPAL